MEQNFTVIYVKIIIAAALVIVLVGLAVAKCVWPALDVGQLNTLLLQLLTGLCVHHISTIHKVVKPNQEKSQ